MQKLNHSDLNATISLNEFGFDSTAELLAYSSTYQPNMHAWVAQSEAKTAAMFG